MNIGIDARLIRETGVGRYIRNLIRYLAVIDRKNSYTIYLLKRDMKSSDIPGHWRRREADVRWHTLREQFVMPKMYAMDGLDIIHVPYFNVPIIYSGRVVVTIHDLTILDTFTGNASLLPKWKYALKHFAYRIVLASAIRRSAKVITVSYAVQREIIKRFGVNKDKVIVTYEGVDDALIGVNKTEKTVKKPHAPYFLYVGNVYPHKNIDTLLQAFLRFREAVRDDVKLVFVGPDDLFYSRLKSVVRFLDQDSAFAFRHNIGDDTLSELYSNAISLVFPSRSEGFGLPAIEAIANGCRVIASDIPVFRELFGQYAVYADTTSVEKLSRSMHEVFRSNHDPAQFSRSVISFLSKFDWKEMAKRTESVYESCI